MGTRTQSVDASTKCRLLYGPQFRKPTSYKSVLCAMCDRVRTVWDDDSILLFRITKLLLAALQFAAPYFWLAVIAEASSKWHQSKRNSADEIAYRFSYLVSDAYILVRLILPLVLLSSAVRSCVWYWVILVLVIETMTFVLTEVFVPGKVAPVSHMRSAFLLVFAFFSLAFSFAFLYSNTDGVQGLNNPTDAIYFSLVTASTTGFGDIHAVGPAARRLVSFQLATSLLFFVSFFPVFFQHAAEKKNCGPNPSKQCLQD